MEDFQFNTTLRHTEPAFPDFSVSKVFDWEKDVTFGQENKDLAMDEDDGSAAADSMLCDSGSSLIPAGFTRPECTDDFVMFVNAGGETLSEAESNINFLADNFYKGGDVVRTTEHVLEAGDYPIIYQSARLGNFSYCFNNLPPGNYFVDLHFVEIINTNGPKGMRVFNVYIQEEKVISDLDIFSIVGANKPLQLAGSRTAVKEDGVIVIRLEGVNGSPVLSGVCIRKAPDVTVPQVTHEYLKCKNCCADLELPSAEKKLLQTKSVAKYEKKIEELTLQCQHKTNECYEAWMSLTEANEQLEKVRMELDNKLIHACSLDQALAYQAENMRNVSTKYEHDKKFWADAVNDLTEKIKIMKQEHSQLSKEAHECAGSVPQLNNMVFAVQALVAQCEDLKVKYSEEQAIRRKLYNQVQEAKGNIRVFCRCRPLSKVEVSAGCATVVDFDSAKDGDIGILTAGSNKKIFKFDRVFTPKDNQADVFEDALPLVTSVLDGYNVCIFAYGQTGTGKTFTMEGTEHNRGVNYRTLEKLFKVAEERSDTFTYNISVSVLEVYNEQIRDLLNTSPASKKLEIKQDAEGSHHVPGIVEAQVENIREVWNVLQAGSNARAVGSNNVNEHSSRSHCMLSVMVKSKNLMNGECTRSKLWLVDLAGSERLAKTDVQGERLKEAQNINRSLSALGDVISALAAKNSHIPYRNSKLTHLLQDSLGGDSKTLMFVQISPSEQDLGETISSLNFAARVRGVELGPARRQIDTGELQKMKQMLDKARQESRSKDESLRKLEESLQTLENKAKSKDNGYKSQLEKIKELEGQIELRIAMQSQSEKQLSQLSERLKGKEEFCSGLQQKVKELETKLRERQQSESATFQQKVKELENKLKEQVKESDAHSLLLQQKIKELERKLKETEQSSESTTLHQKIKELEEKLREQEQQLQCRLNRDSADMTRATPKEGKSHIRDEFMSEVEPRILRSSNSINRLSQGSNLSTGNVSVHEMRRKREFRSGETENNVTIPISLKGHKIRKSDPPPKFAKVTRTVKPVSTTTTTAAAAAAQGTLVHKRINKDQVQAPPKEKRIWTR